MRSPVRSGPQLEATMALKATANPMINKKIRFFMGGKISVSKLRDVSA